MELGSEFNLSLSELSIKNNNIQKWLADYRYCVFFDSGRSALKHLSASLIAQDRILMPEFICESVTNCFMQQEIVYYKIHDDLTIDLNDLASKIHGTKVIFLMHYFGHIQPEKSLIKIQEIARINNCIIIEDTTHSIFSSRSTIGDYQICSIRKWLPIPKGGILYAKEDKHGIFKAVSYKQSAENDRAYAMILKDLFLNEGYDFNAIYRSMFASCEKALDQQNEIRLMSDFAMFILTCFDVEGLKNKRIHNYMLLKETLKRMKVHPVVPICKDECPLVFPIYSSDRDKLRGYLMDNKIYCAIHWPFDGADVENRTYAVSCAEHLISLPIDQRYNDEEIIYQANILKQFGGDF